MFDIFVLIVLPYIALAIFCIVTPYRYVKEKFTVSSLSSQFLESKFLLFGTLPFHIGIIMLFIGHLLLFLFPDTFRNALSNSVTLYLFEILFLTFALSALVGILNLVVRRFTNGKVWRVTTMMDILTLFILLLQIGIGIYVATFYRWGSNWFTTFVSPYLHGLVTFSPSIESIKDLPMMIKIHIILGTFIFGLFPFTRLVHMIVAPFHYLARSYQRVIWNVDWRRER